MAQAARKIEWRESETLNWTPPEELSTSEWAEKHRVLSAPSEERGPLRLIRTPYLVPVMNAFDDVEVEQVVFCKSAQVAGTEGMISVVGKRAHDGNCPIMLVMADEDTALYMSKERIQKMFLNSPELSKLIIRDKFTQKEISLKNESFIALAWSSSVAKLASRPIQVIVFDEVDKPGYSITTKEASAISLGIERTESYYNRKIGILSTPSIEEGNITKELKTCDVIYDWHVPCPHCGQFQPMRWGAKYSSGFDEGVYRGDDGEPHKLGCITWDGGRNATDEQIEAARYQCGECEGRWTTLEKNAAVEQGKSVPRTEATKRRKVGFHVNRLYSLLGKSGNISKLVREWIGCQGDVGKLQGFINSTLAEPFKQVIVRGSESEIYQAKVDLAPQTVPMEAVCLTCGVDVQKYGFWFVVRAWARDYTSWLIHYGNLASWTDVEAMLFDNAYPVEGDEKGRSMRIWRAAVDTGGGEGLDEGLSMTEETELWLIDNAIGRGARVWGTKGASRPLATTMSVGKPRERTPSGKVLKGGLQIISLNTERLKDNLHYRLGLAMQKEPGGAYLHSGTDEQYVKHIMAEEKRINDKGVQAWVKIGSRRNDLLDGECLAAACVDPEWPGGGLNLLRRADIIKEKRAGSENGKQAARPQKRRQRSSGISL